MVHTVVRLVVSHAIAPTVAPERAARGIALVACRCFDPSGGFTGDS